LCFLSYERPAYLRAAIESALKHADEPLEVIVHDDGSTNPAVWDYLWDAHAQGQISHLMLNPPGHNEGVGVAMNRCFKVATGDILIKADQDLVFQSGWLATVRGLLDPLGSSSHPDKAIGLLSGYRYWHDPCDWRKTLIASWEGWDEHEYVMGSFMAIPRAAWEELGPFMQRSPSFSEDHAFQRKVTTSGHWVCGTPHADIMFNQGYGIGPSTVVTGHGQVREIKPGPKLVGLDL
jgi:GT2 family glycosyltransferase